MLLCISYIQGKGHCFCGPHSIYVLFYFFIHCGGSGKGLRLVHRRLSWTQNARAWRDHSSGCVWPVLCEWESEGRGDIANVTNGVRVKAGIGTQDSSLGPLNQEPLQQENETTCAHHDVPGSPALSRLLGTGDAVESLPRGAMVPILSTPMGSLHCLQIQTGEGHSCKAWSRVDSYGLVPCTFASKLQSKETGKTVALLFSSSLFSLMGATIGLHPRTLKSNPIIAFVP